MTKTCFMFGHRDTPQEIQPEIEAAVEKLYLEQNVRYFYVGGYGDFDRMASAAVRAVKNGYSDITLSLVLPYHPAERPIKIPEGFDGSFYPSLGNVPNRYAIVRANRYMVENCDTIICYVKNVGNSKKLLEYARKQEAKKGTYVNNLTDL